MTDKEKALKAVDLIIEHLAESDFVTKHGSAPLETLREYRQDMANDIAEVFE